MTSTFDSSFLVLIPARYQSSRFPGKPLAMIAGKSMIQRVYENCLQSGGEVWVVTDSSEIERHVKQFSGRVCRVDDDVSSGSLRIFLAYQRFFQGKGHALHRLIVNVQGDEPLLKGGEIKRLCEFHLGKQDQFAITTFVRKRESGGAYKNPNVVKVIYNDKDQRCHYFSRSSIPYVDPTFGENFHWYQHIGVYSYTPSALANFAQSSSSSSPSLLEKWERLEQLRALEIGLPIGAIETELDLMGVDQPSDILKIEGVLSGAS